MNEIFVLMSFGFKKNKYGEKIIDEGRRFWFSSLEKALKYLKDAGQPIPGKKDVYYDDPVETLWNYVVIEKVMEGPISLNVVQGWWEASFENGHIKEFVQLDKSPIDNSELLCNFTDVG